MEYRITDTEIRNPDTESRGGTHVCVCACVFCVRVFFCVCVCVCEYACVLSARVRLKGTHIHK